jgi:hypothetical protein
MQVCNHTKMHTGQIDKVKGNVSSIVSKTQNVQNWENNGNAEPTMYNTSGALKTSDPSTMTHQL